MQLDITKTFLQAVENVISIGKKYPLKTRPDEVLNYECYCLPSNYSRVPEQFNWTAIDKETCQVFYNGFVMCLCTYQMANRLM